MDNAGIVVSPLSQKSLIEVECQDIGLVSRGISPNDEPGKKERTAKKVANRAGRVIF
jgi:hypothetical protein